MTNKQINNHLLNAVADITPDIFDKLPQPTLSNNLGGDVIMNTRVKKFPVKLTAFAACAAALTVAASAVVYTNNYMVNSLVSLDVNPSIEVATNKKDKVLSVTALNDDAKKVLETLQLKNSTLDTAINEIMGSMVKNGYITPEKNSILVTVKNDDDQKTQELTETVSESIDETLTENDVEAKVFNLNGEKKGIINQGIAKKFAVSEGKLGFIVTLARLDPSLTLEELAKMTIDELADLIEEKNIDISHIIDLDELRDLEDLDGLVNGKPNGKDKNQVNSGKVPPVKEEEKKQNGKPEDKANNGKPESKPNNGKPEDKANNGKPESKPDNGKPESKPDNGKPEEKANNNKPEDKTNNGNSNKSDLANTSPQAAQGNTDNQNGKADEKTNNKPEEKADNGNSNKSDLANTSPQAADGNNGKSNAKPDNSNKAKGK